ncbi:ribonuclease III domain-containing protein [Coleofasciculus chthonoplastes]
MEWNPESLESQIGIQFKHSDLLRLALMHRSYAEQIGESEQNNERLKFMGNAIFNLVITDYLYHNCPYLEVSNFKGLRDKLVEGQRLTKLWDKLGLGEGYPFLGLTQERHRLRLQNHNPFEEALIALVGAIHQDRGFSQARNWLVKQLIAPLLERHLKKIKERSSPNKQLRFLGDAVLKGIVADYLYGYLPNVKVGNLNDLFKELTSKENQSNFINQITTEELTALNLGNEKVLGKSFKALLAAFYLNRSAENDKRGFAETENWFVERFIDQEQVLRKAIRLLMEDGRSQKWIVRHVMGYESKDYHAGRDRFNQVMEG